MRFVLETLAGILGGLVSWFVVGFAAAQLFTIGGDREGPREWPGFFVIGPMGEIVGFALCWIARRSLERGTAAPAPQAVVAMFMSLALQLICDLPGSIDYLRTHAA
jgi:hypothetical protein